MGIKEKLLVLSKKKGVFREFEIYSFVGALGFLLSLAILYSLTEFLGLWYMLSALISFMIGGTFKFALNKTWTFHEDIERKLLSKLTIFASIGFAGTLLRMSLVYIFTESLGLWYMFSTVIATLLGGVIAFTCNEIWTFRKEQKKRKKIKKK